MEGLKVGDRIIANGIQSGTDISGMIGTIRSARHIDYAIEFDEEVPGSNGHAIGGLLPPSKRSHGYNVEFRFVEPYKYHKFNNNIGDKFKGRRARVIQNGNTFKLVTTSGTVLYTYIPTQGISKITPTKDKTEKLYVELFEQAIEEYNSGKKV